MLKRTLLECPEFLAGDHTVLRELLHPAKQPVQLGYSLAHGRLAPGPPSKWRNLASSELYVFIACRGRVRIGRKPQLVEAGSVVYVPPGGNQSLENIGTTEIEFLCLVDPAWRIEDEQVAE